MREDSAGSPERPARAGRAEPTDAGSKLRAGSGSRTWCSAVSSVLRGGAKPALRGSPARSNPDGAGSGARAVVDCAPAGTPLWRPRPPRRPRRLRWGLGPVLAASGCGAGVPTAGCSKTDSCSPPSTSAEVSDTCSSVNSAMIGSNRATGSVGVSTAAAGAEGTCAPRRARASSAFSFHCARRKRSAAAVYQRAASACAPDFSWIRASSNATMASCVRSNRAANCPGGSALVRALRMRAWICRQSLTGAL